MIVNSIIAIKLRVMYCSIYALEVGSARKKKTYLKEFIEVIYSVDLWLSISSVKVTP